VQVTIDQFVCSGEAKWQRQSGRHHHHHHLHQWQCQSGLKLAHVTMMIVMMITFITVCFDVDMPSSRTQTETPA